MGAEWSATTIGSLLEDDGGEIKTGPFGTKLKASEYSDMGVPVVSVGEVQLGRIVLHDKTPKVGTDITDRMPEYVLREGDIVFGRKGAVERSARVVQKQDGWFLGSDGIRLRLPRFYNTKFIAYQFLTEAHKQWMIQHAAGTTMASLNEGIIRRIPIVLAPRSEQDAIAHILGTLDDKIELNRQMNTTLEAMAQALFKSWFVDFDPVIDNALSAGNPIPEPLQARAEIRKALGEQRKPLPAEIQRQFPSRFVFTEEMGWVPEGWGISCVGDEFDVTMGQSPPGDTYNEAGEGMPFFQGRADFGFRYPSNRVYCTAPTRMASRGDTLVSVRAPVGDVNMAAEDCCIGRGVSASRHKSGSTSFTYYAMLQLHEYFKVYEGEGTVFGSINQKDFKALPQLKIDEMVVRSFELHAGRFDGKIELASKEIEDLTKIRDILLPKLISGQLRIPDAEAMIEQAAAG